MVMAMEFSEKGRFARVIAVLAPGGAALREAARPRRFGVDPNTE